MTNGKIGYGGSGAAGGGSTSAAGAGRKSPVGICDQLDPTVEYFRPRASSCDGIIDMTAASPTPMTDCTIVSIGTRHGGSIGGDGNRNSGGGSSSGNEGSGGGTNRGRDADGNYAIDAPSETPQHTKRVKLTTTAGSSSIDAAQYAPVGRRRDREDRDRFGEGKRTGSPPPPSEPSPLGGCAEETGVPGRLSKFHMKLQTMVGISS